MPLSDQITLINDGTIVNFATTAGTEAERTAISSPNTGEQFYQTDGSEGLYTYDGAAWNLALDSALLGANNGIAELDGTGKIPQSQVPQIAISDTFVVASQAAMLLLSTAETGDIAVRTDIEKSFILAGTDYATLGDWQELLSPTDAVTSVAGKTGVVTLGVADVSNAVSDLGDTMTGTLTLTNGVPIWMSAASGIITIDSNQSKRITWNDGAGNFNIRGGSYYNVGEKYVAAGDGAVKVTLGSDTVSGSFQVQTAVTGTSADDPVTWANAMTLTTTALTTSGSITASGDITAFSDIRVKTAIEPIDNAMQKVMALTGYTFERKDKEDDTRHTGVIAQEVIKVMPEAVMEDDEGMLSVAYGNLVGLLINAIKEARIDSSNSFSVIIDAMSEQQKLISELSKRVEELEAK